MITMSTLWPMRNSAKSGGPRRIASLSPKTECDDYPYYGATRIVDYVDDYIFNEKLILVGEDGANVKQGRGLHLPSREMGSTTMPMSSGQTGASF